ncbi:unnamed protein product [Toxocara canis]|uniref:Uncharacterized protein n=1 Tax=Toxocara canis TaxID=6265 RepID=A0A3P7HBA8_TOXCA|nr:unnamed protein product [Toxocara canis]
MVGLNNDDVFVKKNGGGAGIGGIQPKAHDFKLPTPGVVVGVHDPNYQTLAGLNNDDIFVKKGGTNAQDGGPKPPAFKLPCAGIAATFDPNYQVRRVLRLPFSYVFLTLFYT